MHVKPIQDIINGDADNLAFTKLLLITRRTYYMRLGLSSPLEHQKPQEWAKKHVELGAGSVVFPLNADASEKLIEEYKQEAEKNNLVIAEVGVWRNTLAADAKEKKDAIDYAIRQLDLADRLGANCCVNIIGTSSGPIWDGGYAGNFSKKTWNDAVEMIRLIIDEVKPKNTKYSIEPMPWMYPTGPDEYLKLLEDVGRDEFGVHLDFINMINCPQRYFFMDEFMDECFEKLGDKICSCHLKDVHLLEDFTFQLRETACGKGEMNVKRYIEKATEISRDMPMIIEHLNSDEEYIESIGYVRSLLGI